MIKSIWTKLAIALVGVALVIYFRSEIWYVLTSIASGIWYVVVLVFKAFGGLLIAGIELAGSFLNYIAAFVIAGVALVIGVACIVIPLLSLIRYIIRSLNEIAKQVSNLNLEFREEARRTARDAAFLSLVGTLCAVIAYMATEDFLEKISTIRFLAMCGIGLVAAKIFFFFPSRVAKGSGVFLTATIVGGVVMFVVGRYRLAHLREALLDPHNSFKLLLLAIIAILSTLSLLYPFTWSEWRQLLAIRRFPPSAGASG